MMSNQVFAQPSDPVASAAGPESETGWVVVDTRFGRMEFDPDSTLSMPRGMLGFRESTSFGLAPLPGPAGGQFRLLQSLTDPSASFPVLPISVGESGIAKVDIDFALETTGIAREDVALMLVVTARKSEDKVDLTANLRAPIFVDTRNRVARQLVLPNDKYPIRHAL